MRGPPAPKRPLVRIEGPDGQLRELRVDAGARLIEATRQHRCPTADCGFCVVEGVEGEPRPDEARVLELDPSGLCSGRRLSCHVLVHADLSCVVPFAWSMAEIRGGENG